MHPLVIRSPRFLASKLMGLTMFKVYFIFILALTIMQCDWADGAPWTMVYSLPNLVNSPSLPPYKDVVGGAGGPLPPAADGVPPPPPPCVYPPPAKPALPAPLPPVASPPAGAPPLAGPPSIAPGSSPPGASPPAVAPGSSAPPAPPFMPPVAFPTTPPSGQARRPGMWCVASPKAASAVLQAAMDYACGSGADCGAAAPGAPCYLPDTMTAHASYAFNSYWQRTKAAGGTCDFAGAAMLVTRDPSYDDCRYVYT